MNLKNKISKQNRNRIIDTENVLMVVRWQEFWDTGENCEGIKKYKFVFTEYPGGCKPQHREWSSKRTYIQD